jgi:hypothetical protein
VVVDSLLPVANTSPPSEAASARSSLGSAAAGSPNKERSSPPKKKRCRKSNSPKSAGSAGKSVSFGGGDAEVPSENLPTGGNILPVQPTAAVTKAGPKVSKVTTRVTFTAGDSLLSSLAASRSTHDDAINAFDRLLASTTAADVSATKAAQPVAIARATVAVNRRGGAAPAVDSLFALAKK